MTVQVETSSWTRAFSPSLPRQMLRSTFLPNRLQFCCRCLRQQPGHVCKCCIQHAANMTNICWRWHWCLIIISLTGCRNVAPCAGASVFDLDRHILDEDWNADAWWSAQSPLDQQTEQVSLPPFELTLCHHFVDWSNIMFALYSLLH